MKPKNTPENTPAKDTEVPSFNPNPETSSQYYRDKETGDWKIHNPAGSMVYNYLTREDMDLD
ncbi:MAG TPA: hypothetical protein VK469_04560 [Candidatus Kapabacteria bacterium]|nr:hypothetical protein [Candidatus Kapabacteria bacterium]